MFETVNKIDMFETVNETDMFETVNETDMFETVNETDMFETDETENNMNETVLCDIEIEPKNIIDCRVKKTDNVISEGVIEVNIVDKCPNETIQKAVTVNKSNLSPATIEESRSKHLFWPKPDTKKKQNRSHVKLPFAVTAITWREYHASKEQEKLKKEEELTQKRKRKEGIKKEKGLKVVKKNHKKTGTKKIKK
ncbi:uncharacterized protein LOC126552172 [Aphis gossypii]|uniref:uncharacterized protein LOC126552172 n=1 Tax=Aphis gossypii TaxID=80765 RepID=UPI0021593746|nr:uncharacterized protein LOC126552172 [Aphis gossypii]